jgi:predicted HTH domain antitoxin
MTQVTVSLLEETLLAFHLTPDELVQELRLAAAVKLYELGRLSSGAAANLAGVPRVVFLSKLADYGVLTFQLAADELAEDLSLA